MGHAIDDLAPNVREWSIPFGGSGYVARYRIEGNGITIFKVKHFREAG